MAGFGDLLRRLRGSRTQKEVARDLGIPITTLSTFENQEAVPRSSVLRKLATYYDVPLTYFYSGPATEIKATDGAKAWLQQVREASAAKSTIATFASADFPEDLKARIAALIDQKKNG
jgi:transcriptional regulator with XRE-family HTH domain